MSLILRYEIDDTHNSHSFRAACVRRIAIEDTERQVTGWNVASPEYGEFV
jgi:hypothetical protein